MRQISLMALLLFVVAPAPVWGQGKGKGGKGKPGDTPASALFNDLPAFNIVSDGNMPAVYDNDLLNDNGGFARFSDQGGNFNLKTGEDSAADPRKLTFYFDPSPPGGLGNPEVATAFVNIIQVCKDTEGNGTCDDGEPAAESLLDIASGNSILARVNIDLPEPDHTWRIHCGEGFTSGFDGSDTDYVQVKCTQANPDSCTELLVAPVGCDDPYDLNDGDCEVLNCTLWKKRNKGGKRDLVGDVNMPFAVKLQVLP